MALTEKAHRIYEDDPAGFREAVEEARDEMWGGWKDSVTEGERIKAFNAGVASVARYLADHGMLESLGLRLRAVEQVDGGHHRVGIVLDGDERPQAYYHGELREPDL